mgnify:CR=1 FL=1
MLHDSAQSYRRSLAVKWVESGMSQTEAARRLEVTQGAVSQWVARAREGGEDALKTQPRSGRPPRLPAEMVPRVLAALEALGPEGFGYDDQRWTTQRIADTIARLTDVRYSTSKISDLLRQWGWSWQVPKRRDSRRDEATVEHWREQLWPELKKICRGSGRDADLCR